MNKWQTSDILNYELLKKNAKSNRESMTEAENFFWNIAKSQGLGEKCRRQYIIGNYIVDFFFRNSMLIVELDGGYHFTNEQQEEDAIRQNYLEKLGYKILRFTNQEILFDTDTSINIIKQHLCMNSDNPNTIPTQKKSPFKGDLEGLNILVTGANGQLGNEIRIVAKQSTDTFVFTDVVEQEGAQTIKLDITNLADVRQIVEEKKIDVIINCAAYTNVDAAEAPENYNLCHRLNALAPQNLATAIKEVGGLLVHISTDYVFGAEPYNTPCNERQEGTPTGVYGKTKLIGEQNIMNVFGPSKSPLKGDFSPQVAADSSPFKGDGRGSFVIIRTAWLYSEFGKNFCKTMLNLTASKPALKVVFDQCGTPTYAYDLAQAIATIIEDYKQQCQSSLSSSSSFDKSGIYHFSNEGVCSWFDFTKMIAEYSGQTECDIQPCYSSEYPSPVKRPAYSVLDKSKIKQTFGIKIPYWTESLKKCINNLK